MSAVVSRVRVMGVTVDGDCYEADVTVGLAAPDISALMDALGSDQAMLAG